MLLKVVIREAPLDLCFRKCFLMMMGLELVSSVLLCVFSINTELIGRSQFRA